MKKIYALLLLVAGCHLSFAQIKLTVSAPAGGQIVDADIFVAGTASSAGGAIVSITATAGGKTDTLVPGSNFSYAGTLRLVNAVPGNIPIRIQARDAGQHVHDTVVTVLYDPRPQIVFDSAVTTGIARPMLRIRARAADNGPVSEMQLRFNGQIHRFSGAQIDTTIDAAILTTQLSVSATDSLGQQGSADLPYSLNTSAGFRLVYSAPLGADIHQIGHGKILLTKNEKVHIIDTASGQIASQPYNLESSSGQQAWLTADGAYFRAGFPNALFAWKTGGTAQLIAHAPKSISSGGNAIAWVSPSYDSLYYQPGMNAPVRLVAVGASAFHVGEDGSVVYALRDQTLYRYENDASVPLYTDRINNNFTQWMVQDRRQIAFYSTTITGANFLRLYNNGSAPLLHRGDYMSWFTPNHIALDSGRLAWANYKSIEPEKRPVGVYLKMPGDTIRNIYPGCTGSPLAIGKGGVLVGTGQLLEYIPFNGAPRPLGMGYRRFYKDGGRWYVSFMNALYVLDTAASNRYEAKNANVQVYFNTPHYFTVKDFTDLYTGPADGPGQLSEIEITERVPWGTVYRPDGRRVTKGSRLKRHELDSLRYEPIFNMIGADTLKWRGTSGTGFSNVSAITFITYPDLKYPPRIAGLDSNYAANVPSDKIRIMNLPPPKWRTVVTVTLDGSKELPVSADSTFTITPSAYSPGLHYLRVTFRHPLDSAATMVRFNVVPLVETQALAHGEQKASPELKVWPNPFAGQFNVQGLDADRRYQLSVHNTAGQLVYRKTVQGQSTVAVTGLVLPPGMYFLQIFDVSAGKIFEVKKIVKM
ncbi:T9SS type A sorting domain-containing protein [Chitinophaga sp. NPDC101104]|uniref:T9SS type A sorting domain-containing protein n=1 Tax=Chitinophaga sp. NPDC101104 TaxID=3390561 RepID=UPI003D052165